MRSTIPTYFFGLAYHKNGQHGIAKSYNGDTAIESTDKKGELQNQNVWTDEQKLSRVI